MITRKTILMTRSTSRISKSQKYTLALLIPMTISAVGALGIELAHSETIKSDVVSSPFQARKSVTVVDNLSPINFTIQVGKTHPIEISGRNNKTIIETDNAYIGKPLHFSVEAEGLGENAVILANDTRLTRNGNQFSGEIVLEKISHDDNIELKVFDGDDDRTYLVRTLPEEFPTINFENTTQVDKDLFYYTNFYPTTAVDYRKNIPEEKQFGSYVVKFDHQGNVVFYQRNKEAELVNFNRWEDDITGEKGYYYFVETKTPGFGHRSYKRGEYVILDDNFQEIDRVKPQKTMQHNTDDLKTEMHDFVFLEKGHYIMSDYVPREHNGSTVIDTYLQEQVDGEVVWEWSSNADPLFADVYNKDISSFEVIPSAGGSHAIDGIHTNSVFIDPTDGNIILSNRNIDAITKIDKLTGKVIWVMGGEHNQFDLQEAEGFNRQHHARINDKGQIMFYDNNSEGDVSRGIVADIDQENKKLTNVQEFLYGDQHGMYTGSIGQHDIKGKTYTFIGWGMERPHSVLASLFDEDGNSIKNISFEEGLGVETYRFMSYED